MQSFGEQLLLFLLSLIFIHPLLPPPSASTCWNALARRMWCRSGDVKKKRGKKPRRKSSQPPLCFFFKTIWRRDQALRCCSVVKVTLLDSLDSLLLFFFFATWTLRRLLSHPSPSPAPGPPGGEPLPPPPPCLLAGFSSLSLLFIHKPLFSSLNCSIFEGSHICQLSVGGWHRCAWRHLQRLPL